MTAKGLRNVVDWWSHRHPCLARVGCSLADPVFPADPEHRTGPGALIIAWRRSARPDLRLRSRSRKVEHNGEPISNAVAWRQGLGTTS